MKLNYLAAGAVALATLAASPASANTERLVFDVENATASTLTALYISRTGKRSWEEDMLELDVLRPGESVTVTIDDGLPQCEYDLLAEFKDGESLELYEVDMCDLDGEILEITD